MKLITIATTIFAFFISLSLSAEFKADKDVSYGPHERNILDVYWDTKFKNAPIVFTIHGGGFKNGSKAYCNKDMIKLYMTKGCIVVSPNYRLVGKGEPVTKDDCAMDTAMAVAHIQANAKKYGGDPTKIVSTGASAGGYISAWIAYQKNWEWPANAKHKPKKLNIVGWFGNSPFLPSNLIEQVWLRRSSRLCYVRGKKGTPRHPSQAGLRNPSSPQEKQGSGAKWSISTSWDTCRPSAFSSARSHETRKPMRPTTNFSTWSATAKANPREATSSR